jgi:peptidyl-prolyl cis-trans isomerase D
MAEFLQARFFETGMRKTAPQTPEGEKNIRRRAWERIIALRQADKMGLAATDQELSQVIQKDPSFAVNGVFNKERYESIVRSQLGVDMATFETYVRQDITLQKLVKMLESVLWTPPTDVNRRLEGLTDTFVVEYAGLKRDALVSNVVVTDQDARKLFEENPALFTIPEKVSVRYVSYPVSNYAARVKLEEADILDYYDGHQDDYSRSDTNGTSLPIPLAEVQPSIEALLLRQQAATLARDAATEFAVTLTPDRYGRALSFDDAARTAGLTIATSDFFSADGDVPGLGVGPEFNRAAFRLDKSDPEAYFSDALVGTAAVYVVAADQRQESRLPAYEEVSNQVMAVALRQAESNAFEGKVEEIREAAAKALSARRSFAEAMSDWKLSVATTRPFNVYGSSSEGFEHSDVLIPAVMALRKGDLTKSIESTNGPLLAFVSDRRTGEPGEAELLRPQLLATLDRYRARLLFADWREYLLSQARLEDTYSRRVSPDDESTEDEPSDGNEAEKPASDMPDPSVF